MLDPGDLPMPIVPFKTPIAEFQDPRELNEAFGLKTDNLSKIKTANELDKEIFSYTINAKPGERFVVEPNFSISTSDHYVKSSTTKDDSGNIISTTFKVFK